MDVPATTELGLILKSNGSWDWKGADSDLKFENPDKKGATIYLVDGQAEVFTSVDDIPEDKAPVEDTQTGANDTETKNEPTTGSKKNTMDPGTIAWIVVGVVVAATAVIAFFVVKKLTANLPEAVAEEVVVEEATEENEEA